MSGNTWFLTKRQCKIVAWFSYIFNNFFWHSIRFPWINPSSATKIFDVFFAGLNNLAAKMLDINLLNS